ncbi:MAG: hypothetical protein HOJ16_05870 [Candidatus Peribacter sp.]|jgi:hypothetical protein|nr:hypothetical protein [Candidatus Peribacter sp.]
MGINSPAPIPWRLCLAAFCFLELIGMCIALVFCGVQAGGAFLIASILTFLPTLKPVPR